MYYSPSNRVQRGFQWLHSDLLPIVADRLIDEGYNIKPLLEPLVPNNFLLSEKEETESFTGSLFQFGLALIASRKRHRFRDAQVANQLIKTVEKAERDTRKTNIYVLRGTYHSVLVLMMPYKYRDSMHASTEFEVDGDPFQLLLKKAMIDEEVDPDAVRDVFLHLIRESIQQYRIF